MPESEDILAQAGHSSHESEFFNPEPDGYQRGRHKYVAVFGTVMSGLGKGIFSSSLAKLLKDKSLVVAPIKMEGYLNIDSGTLNPYRHGEVFVLDDGLETDMDLGTYERMLDQNLTRDNYTTSGQIFRRILDKERHGGYLGRDVQMIPHVTGEVKYMLRELAVKQDADVVFIEVGGTVGDHENAYYIEALRQLAFEEGDDAVCFVAMSYVIEPPALGEQKSKAAQLGLKKLMEAGIQPHMVAVRAQHPVEQSAREKIAMFSNVPMRRTFSMHDRASIYTVPEAIRQDGLDREVLTILGLHSRVNPAEEDRARARWNGFVEKLTDKRPYKVRIGITGKYASLRDAYASIDKALEHCGAHLAAEIELQWIDTTKLEPEHATEALQAIDAVIVPGGFGARGTEAKIACVRYCREHGIPYLGICMGFQMAVVEYARHVCGLEGAGSTEFDPEAAHPVIGILPEQKQVEGLGGNMRLGGKDVAIEANTLAARLYAGSGQGTKGAGGQATTHSTDSATRPLGHSAAALTIRERFRHRYEVDPAYIDTLQQNGLVFSGHHPDQPIMQILELPASVHPYFVATQFHPELTSRPLVPAPTFMGLVAAGIRRAHPEAGDEPFISQWLTSDQPAQAAPQQ
jgi:CTP synthase